MPAEIVDYQNDPLDVLLTCFAMQFYFVIYGNPGMSVVLCRTDWERVLVGQFRFTRCRTELLPACNFPSLFHSNCTLRLFDVIFQIYLFLLSEEIME